MSCIHISRSNIYSYSYSFIDLLCKLYINTHTVLCGTTYRSTVKSSEGYIRLFVINCWLCVPKIVRLGQSVWKVQAKCALASHGTSTFDGWVCAEILKSIVETSLSQFVVQRTMRNNSLHAQRILVIRPTKRHCLRTFYHHHHHRENF